MTASSPLLFTQDHGFFLFIAFGVSGLLIGGELLLLWRRCRRARRLSTETLA